MYPTEIEFNGEVYRRYPAADKKNHQRYFQRVRDRKALHRVVWEFFKGPIPPGHHIHHVNGDWSNNDISNLECLSPKEHGERHKGENIETYRENLRNKARPAASKWHGSEEGRKWHSEKAIKQWETAERKPVGTCAGCGGPVLSFCETKRSRDGMRYCSRRCIERVVRRDGLYVKTANCPICGKEFTQNKYRAKPETCSRLCGAQLRKTRTAHKLTG
jgi:hypothetical protein